MDIDDMPGPWKNHKGVLLYPAKRAGFLRSSVEPSATVKEYLEKAMMGFRFSFSAYLIDQFKLAQDVKWALLLKVRSEQIAELEKIWDNFLLVDENGNFV